MPLYKFFRIEKELTLMWNAFVESIAYTIDIDNVPIICIRIEQIDFMIVSIIDKPRLTLDSLSIYRKITAPTDDDLTIAFSCFFGSNAVINVKILIQMIVYGGVYGHVWSLSHFNSDVFTGISNLRLNILK